MAPCDVLWGMHWSRVPTCGICVFQNQRKPPRHRTFYSVVGTYSNVSLLGSGPPDTSLTLKTCAYFLVSAFRIPESFPEVAHPWVFVGRALYLLEHTLLTKVSSTLAMDLLYWRDGSVWCSAGFQMVQISSDYIQTGGGRANMALAQNCKWILLFIPTNMNCFWSSSTSIFSPSSFTICYGKLRHFTFAPWALEATRQCVHPIPWVLARVLNPMSWASDSKSMSPCLFTFTFQRLVTHPQNPLPASPRRVTVCAAWFL